MSGVEFIMLAHGMTATQATIFALLFWGPGAVFGIVGLVLSFFTRRKWLALAMAVIGCSIIPLLLLLEGGGRGMIVMLEIVFLEWKWNGFLLLAKAPIMLGIITVVRVYYLHRNEKKRRHRAAMEGYTTKPENF